MIPQEDKFSDTEPEPLSRQAKRYLAALERREKFLAATLNEGIKGPQQRQFSERELAALRWVISYARRSLAYEPELTALLERADAESCSLEAAGAAIYNS